MSSDWKSQMSLIAFLWPEKAYRDTLLKLASLLENKFDKFVNYKIGKDGKLTAEIQAAGPQF